jgi:hypothetical protein
MNTLFNILISFILGIISFLVIEYLFYRFYKNKNHILYTDGISQKSITYNYNYQELLTARLGIKSPYVVIIDNKYNLILPYFWSIFDIKKWLESLNNQDFSVVIEFCLNDDLILERPRIILTNEFMVNNLSDPIIISTLISTQT